MKEWLSRWWQNKGFGIESKTDYAFLMDVIKEENLYYAYDEMERQHPEDSDRERRKRELRDRVENALKGKDYAIVEGRLADSDEWQKYIEGRYITYDMVDFGIAIRTYDREAEHYKILRRYLHGGYRKPSGTGR